MTITATPVETDGVIELRTLAAKLIDFLESGVAADDLFTADVFCDFTMPLWRLQAEGREAVVALRTDNHPAGGRVPRSRFDITGSGFLLELEEEWDHGGHSWYCRELIRCDVADSGAISAISVYCTGDWDEAQVARHTATVQLTRR